MDFTRSKQLAWTGLNHLVVAILFEAEAVTIAWGTGNAEDFFDSDGNALNGSNNHGGFTAYIGFFDTITPSSTNLASWNGDFVVFDSTTVNLGATDIDFDSFSSSAELNLSAGASYGTSNGTGASASNAFPGEQAYVWVRNQTSVDSNLEWTLYTNPAWVFPTSEGTHPAGLDLSLSATTNDVFGLTNHGTGGPYIDPTPPEVRSDPNASFLVGVQTATIIPEPSCSLLSLFGSGMLTFRRCRKG